MAGPDIQNFEVPAGDAKEVGFNVGPDESGVTLSGARIFWKAYEQKHGVPLVDEPAVIEKDSDDGGITIESVSDLTFTLELEKADTVGLLGNYYHEVTIIDSDDKRTTPTVGIMTVTQTENRDA